MGHAVSTLMRHAMRCFDCWWCELFRRSCPNVEYNPDDKGAVTPAGNPVPHILHRRLTTAHPGQLRSYGRCIIVGDIHGCIEELQDLLVAVNYQHGKDNIFVVGDQVTKGPASQEVAQFMRELGACCSRGNNDDLALAAYWAWRRGEEVPDKFAFVAGLTEADVKFLSQLPFSVSLPEYGVIIVHAGLVPLVPLWHQQLWAVCSMRVLFLGADGVWRPFDGEKTPTPIGSLPWAQCWGGPQHVVFGHDSKRMLQLERFATGIDTSCCSGGALTACVLPPLDVLRRSEAFRKKLERRQPLTLQDLQGRTVSVPSRQPPVMRGAEKQWPRCHAVVEDLREAACLCHQV